MAVATNARGSGAILLPSGFNYKQAMTGSTPGITLAFMYRIPSANMASNGPYSFGGRDVNGDGTFTDSAGSRLVIDADNAARPARARPAFASNAGSGNMAGTNGTPLYFVNAPQAIPGQGYLAMVGVRNVGSVGTPDWRVYWAGGQMGGTVASEVLTQGASFSTWLSTANPFFDQIFADLGTSTFRTPADAAMENVAIIWHDIPWDAANNRPDHAAIQPLLNGSATYEDATFLNGGTIKDWRKLASASDLADYGDDSRAAATLRGVLVDAAPIGTGAWLGDASITVNEQPIGWVYGGRGARTQTFSGTYGGPVTSLQYRVERNTGTVASPTWTLVSGYDWQAAGGTFGGGTWSFSLPGNGLPVGANYRLLLRDSGNPATTAQTANRWHVGKIVLMHGQSQLQRAEEIGRGIRNPIANMAASVMRLAGGGRTAGGGTYEQPTMAVVDLVTSTSTGGGYMAMANADWEATGEPAMYLDMTVEGTGLSQWNSDAAYGNFFYRGDNASLPTASSVNGSGIMTMFALSAGRYRDVDLFNWGTSDTSDVSGWATKMATYRGHVDTYFSNSPATAPMIILPYPRSCGGSAWPAPLNLRNTQRAYALSTARTVRGPDLLDIIMDGDGGNHPRALIADSGSFTREIAGEGSQRMGLTMGRALAVWGTSGAVALGAPVMASAVFGSGNTTIDIECGQALQTMNSAALAQLFVVSEDSGTNFSSTGLTATLVGTKVRLTKTSGSWPDNTTRVDYCREMPFQSSRENTEAAAASLVDGLAYGLPQAWRDGRGMHLQPIGGTGLAVTVANNFAAAFTLPSITAAAFFSGGPASFSGVFTLPSITANVAFNSVATTQQWTIVTPRPATITITFSEG